MLPELISDRPVLDFVATVAERGTTDLEHLNSPDDLRTWITRSGLLDEPPPMRAADLNRAKDSREAFFAVIAALINRTDIPESSRRLLNADAARPQPRLTMSPDGVIERAGDLDAVLAALAADLLDLAAGDDRHLTHWCADPKCTRPFIDRSRGARRRWCGMKGCGDRAKAAAYRRRRRQDHVS